MQRILVVEDEFLLALHIAEVLEDEGFVVIGPAASLSEAASLASSEDLDGALLDINIVGGRVDDVADILARRGVPFMFVTAYGRDHLPKAFVGATLVNKPFDDRALVREVRRIGLPGASLSH
jgi:DNA-binding response OmpR family regulator